MVKQGRKEKNIIEKMQDGEGESISKMFFLDYLTLPTMTRIIYPSCKYKPNNFVMPTIQRYAKEFKERGFLYEKKFKTLVKKKGIKPYYLDSVGYKLSLEPFFIYCTIHYHPTNDYLEMKKETDRLEEQLKKGIYEKKELFNKEEKRVISFLLNQKSQRVLIYKEFPSEDLFNAILKFYIKHYIIPFGNLGKIEHFLKTSNKVISKEEIKKLEESEEKSEELLKLVKKNPKEFEKEFCKSVENAQDMKFLYIMEFKRNPKFMQGIDEKFMKILGIL
jgi:hypothetical protein